VKQWRDGECLNTITGHSGCVRSLERLRSGQGFVTSANDGTVRVWSLEGECLQVLKGHTAFVYSVGVLESGEIVSCSEDRTARVWKDGRCVQSIAHPAISVWCVAVLNDGSLVTGSNDGAMRVFTRDSSRMASADVLESFEGSVRNFAIPSNELDDVDPGSIKAEEEALSTPGVEIGEVRLVRTSSGRVREYQWNGEPATWEIIGLVEESPDPSQDEADGDKPTFEGRTYDFVFEVEQGEGKPHLRLPFNAAQNPNAAAQDFIQRENLSQGFMQQISDFICQSARVPKPDPALLSSQRTYTLAAQPDVALLLTTIRQRSEQISLADPPRGLTEEELKALETAVDVLGRTDDYQSTSLPEKHFEVLKKLLQWPEEERTTALELLQATLQHPTGAGHLGDEGHPFFVDLLASSGLQPHGKVPANQEMGLRCLINAFKFGAMRAALAKEMPFLLEQLEQPSRAAPLRPTFLDLLHKYSSSRLFCIPISNNLFVCSMTILTGFQKNETLATAIVERLLELAVYEDPTCLSSLAFLVQDFPRVQRLLGEDEREGAIRKMWALFVE